MVNLSVVEGGNANALPEYVDYLYDGLSGFVAAATKKMVDGPKPGTQVPEFKRMAFEWPAHRDHLLDWIMESSKTHDVYLAPAIFSEPSGKREFFKETNVVWTEFDGSLPTEADLGDIPRPTMRVQSSGPNNQHWYWRLDAPLDNVTEVESINRALTYQLGGDSSVWDAGQILRPPNTYNHKREVSTSLLDRRAGTVAPNHFDVLPPVEPVSVDLPSEIPDVADVVLKYPFSQEVIDLYRSRVEPGDERSDRLMKLGYFLAEMGLSDAEMFSVLRNADDRWGKFRDRTDRNTRLSDLIGRAKRKYPDVLDVPDNLLTVFGLKSFLATDITIEWVIEGLLQTMGYMLLTGPSGVGKTQFSLRVAMALALGRDFLGMKIDKPYKIVFLSLEMGHADLKYFLSTMAEGMSEDDLMLLEQNFLVIPVGEAIYMDQSDQQAIVEELVREFEPTGLFIDSVGSSTSGNVSDEGAVKALMNFNDRLRQRHHVFTWFIHHQRKAQADNKKPKHLSDVYGNQYLVNRATSVYCLWPEGSSIEVIPLKKRLAAMEEPWLINRMSNLDFIKKPANLMKAGNGKIMLDELDQPTDHTNSGIFDL